MVGVIDWTAAAAIASAISAIAAAVSAGLSYRSIRSNAAAAKEQRAFLASFQFVDLSLKHKKLSTSVSGEDYEWYITALLSMVREVLAAYSKDAERRNQMKAQLSYHRQELAKWDQDDKRHVGDFGIDVSRLVDEILNAQAAAVG